MMVVVASAIVVVFLLTIWRQMPHDVDADAGGHWTPETRPADPTVPTVPADVDDVNPSSAPTPPRRSAPLVDLDVPSDPIRRCAPLVEPVDVDSDPDVETTVDATDEGETDPDPLDEATPYDSKRCWGCEKRCTYRAFRLPEGGTRDEIHRRAEILYRAEHGCASDLDQIDGSDVARVSLSAEELDFDPIAVAKAVGESKRRAWFELCETCVDDLRARRDNPPVPASEPAAVAAAEECPF